MDEYRRLVTLPFFVQMKLDEGYEIVHIGAVDLIEMPPANRSAVNRAWTLFSEARYTYTFWSIYQAKEKENSMATNAVHKWARSCQWSGQKFEYKGLNSHSPLQEKPKGIEIELDGLVSIAEEARKRHQAYMLIYNKKYNKAKMDAVKDVRAGTLSRFGSRYQGLG